MEDFGWVYTGRGNRTGLLPNLHYRNDNKLAWPCNHGFVVIRLIVKDLLLPRGLGEAVEKGGCFAGELPEGFVSGVEHVAAVEKAHFQV